MELKSPEYSGYSPDEVHGSHVSTSEPGPPLAHRYEAAMNSARRFMAHFDSDDWPPADVYTHSIELEVRVTVNCIHEEFMSTGTTCEPLREVRGALHGIGGEAHEARPSL